MLLRLCLGVALIDFGTTGIWNRPSEPITYTETLIATGAAAFLLTGLWTPATAVLIAAGEVWIAFSYSASQPAEVWTHIFLSLLSLSLAMLGPGAWSIDARLFGRKRIDIDRGRG